jgi:hypothetical protein
LPAAGGAIQCMAVEMPGQGPQQDRWSRMQVDTFIRTIQQHHVQLSSLADTKASILITIASITLTIALSRSGDLRYRAALLTLTVGCLLALFLAILAVIPKFTKLWFRRPKRPEPFNLLFFGHFALLSEEEYMNEMREVLSSDSNLQEAALRDIYTLGVYLYYAKYRYLRYAYFALLISFIAASIVQATSLMMNPR